ncbi:ABC-2 type transport system permease protein [Saccharothrix ecbatanensis]|jgi:ABC-2 type transport system permease protein|uniref:Transport permease protein n=1 Tax=Saccharothrix ecbatanensis TaxID=1105145 RepID=A0A7W9M001_9PSEU|nr:ABC transporter permease [Saccharothrix ecbatanensis]MBB5802454.1 ABC-2 type transport system permease protein [Saccharothrix ecbatanensis]
MTTSTAPATEGAARRGALSARTRPPKAGPLSAALTFAWRSMLKLKHVPDQMSDAVVLPVMFTLMFTFLFGGAISGTTHDYLQFFLPGVMVLAVTLSSVFSGISLNLDLSKGSFDRFRTLPIWRPSMLIGAALGDTFRYFVASLVPFLVGLLLGFRPGGGVVGLLLALLFLQLFAFCLSWLWTMFALLLSTPTGFQGLTMPIQFVLVFASNVMVPPQTMPGWLDAVVSANPISHVATAVRGLLHGTVTAGQLGAGFLACAAFLVVFGTVTSVLFSKRQR